ncbi:MAG: hypothetical protein LBH14_06215 [Desulfobulbaceae bacterium]|jgi:hypothetical protein|nr:hypothetical protein [Desulfobulbaceae bacterium]
MTALLLKRLREHLAQALASLKLLGQSPDGDVTTAPKVFIGDVPPKRMVKESSVYEVPCVVIVPVSGHLLVANGAAASETVIAICCCVYNPDKGERADLEEVEAELAALLSAVTGALLPCAQGTPLAKRFDLVPDEKGRMLDWVRAEDQPKPFSGATITSRWWFKGWE